MAAAKRTLKFPSILENIHLAEKLIDDVVAEYRHEGRLLRRIAYRNDGSGE